MLYSFKREQKFPLSLQDLWNFMSNPKNLAVITPPGVGFKTLSGDEQKMFAGQIIQYKITPVFGIKIEWVTEITHVVAQSHFVDEQRYGPYKFWHHKHFFNQIPGGVEMLDIVHYKLPFGILGRIAHPLLVKPKLKEIFDFREKKLIALFGEMK